MTSKKLTDEEILAMQPPSTRAKLTGEYDKLYRGLEYAQVKDKDGKVFLNERTCGVEEITIEERRRRSIKNTKGQWEGGHLSKETKEKAIDAFVYSPSIVLLPEEFSKITGLVPIKSEAPPKKEPKEEREPKFQFCSDSIYVFGIKIW